MKVLIVDGSSERRRELTNALADLGNVVVQGAVPDVRSALRAVVDAAPDLVITDVTLPDGDGTYLIERIRKMARMPSIIVAAQRTSEEQRLHYLAAGADRYVDANPHVVRTAIVQFAQMRLAAGTIPIQDTHRLLGRLTAGAVHDFNNYLHAAAVSLELIQRLGPSPDLIASALQSLDAMQRLNTTLLAYARGGVPTTMPIDFGAVVTEMLDIVRRIIPATISVKLDVVAGARPVIAVRSELEQLILNLLINAVDAMPSGGVLEISVRGCTSRAVMLAVADSGNSNGNGMTVVFDEAISTKRPGLGLGLGIVRTVVAQQGGALRIVPRETGGTMVAVMLPTAKSRPA